AVGFQDGILIGAMNGAHPITSTGAILQTVGSATVAKGIDLSSYSFSTSAFLSTGFSIDGSGNLAALAASFSAPVTINCNSQTLPSSNNTTMAVCDNFSNGSGEANFFNTQNNGGGFDWRQKTGSAAATLLASLTLGGFTLSSGVFGIPQATWADNQ